MKPGDIVYGKYKGKWGECKVLAITKVTTGHLWWKETVEIALVKFKIQRKETYFSMWEDDEVIKEIPVSELRGVC